MVCILETGLLLRQQRFEVNKILRIAGLCFFVVTAHAITVTPGGAPGNLIAALTNAGSGLTVNSLTISGNGAGAGASWGTYTNASGTYGIGGGIIISTGKASDYGDGPDTVSFNSTDFGTNATTAQSNLLTPIGGAGSYHDVTEIDVNFNLDATHDTVFFNVVFGSEEYPDFVGPWFVDSFGLLVNGTNIAFVGGLPVNINHPDFSPVSGTELNGVLAPGGVPAVTFSKTVGFGSTNNTLQFLIADLTDGFYDSTAYINGLGGVAPSLGGGANSASVPEPGSLALLSTLVIGLAWTNRKRFSF
jgi:hypothetical protein